MQIELTDGEYFSLAGALEYEGISWKEAVGMLQGQFENALQMELQQMEFRQCQVCGAWGYGFQEHECVATSPEEADVPPAPVVRLVTIPLRERHGGVLCTTVEVEWRCPVCGAERGEAGWSTSFDGSRTRGVHVWSNPCGHVDLYSDVLREAARRLQSMEERVDG